MSYFDEITDRICSLQKSNIELKDQINLLGIKTSRDLDNFILKIIDILDMLESFRANKDLVDGSNSSNIILNKVEKRLNSLLKSCGVSEVKANRNGNVIVGKTKVIETKIVYDASVQPGTILDVCRKGYEREDKVIRSAEVITAGNGSY